MSACPCGRGDYESCCGPRHDGTRPAETAEALMRSRYSAFVKADVAYLRDTQLKDSEPSSWKQTEAWTKSVTWLSLEIVDAQEDVVEFIARYLDGETVTALRERSSFTRVDGRWRYDAGTPQVTESKVERNAPCPCGSGKKFKACHA